jgi:hypothetical protein
MGRKVRKTAIGLPCFVKVNSHLKIALLYNSYPHSTSGKNLGME